MFSQAEAYERFMGRWSRLLAPAFISFSAVDVANLPKDRQAVLRERLRERVFGAAPNHGIDMQARAWAVKGTVPSRSDKNA